MKVFHIILSYVILSTALPIYVHFHTHRVFSYLQAALTFFLTLNSLICIWEISLGLNITHIKNELGVLQKKYGKNRFGACIDFFLLPLPVASVFSLKFWSRVWSTYGLYDPSYANRESFGFFVDVGNGWTTIIPSLLFLWSMTFPVISARAMGMIGLIKFYQEFYGTCIYFLSFFFNGRHIGKGFIEVALFVGLTNGLWFFFPLAGMVASAIMIQTDSYDIFM